MLQPSFSVYASRSVHLSGLSMGRRSSRSSVIHRLGISGDGDLSVELFWRWQTSDGWGLSVGLRSPLQRQELLRVRLMSVLAEGKNDAKNPVFNDTWISENQDDISSRQSWQLCMRAFSRTITGHNICASVKKQRQWSKFSLILERQDPKAELFEATLEKKTTETMSETKIVFGNRNSPQRHFGLTINSLNTSEGSFLKFDASNPVFPVSLNSSLQAGGGIAAAQLLAGSQSYSFLGNWSRNSSDWRLTGDVSRVDRPWQRFGLDLVSDAVSGTDQLTVRFPNGSRRINSLDGDFGSLTLARTLRLRVSDFEAAISARLTESGSNETASARFRISGGRVSNGSSDKLVFVQSTEARQLGVGWMRHRLETSVSRAGIENGLGTLNLSLGHRLELFTHSALGRSFSMLPSDVFSDRTDTINVSLAETRGEKWLALSGGGEIFSLVGTLGQRLEVPKALLNLSVSDAGSNFMSLCQARGALTILSSNSSRSTTVAASMGLIETADGVFRPAPLESFNLDVRFIRSPSGMRIYKETDGIAFNIKHYWPALTSLNQSLRLTIDTQRFREPKHSKNAIYFQQSLLHLPENRGLTHQISADGSLVPRNFSLTNQLSWLAYRRGFFKLVSLFELNGKCLFRMKQQVELAENYSASASTWWHRVGYALTVETPNNSHLLRSGGLKISTQAAVDDATVKAARQLVRADFVAIDRASANAVTAAFLRQLWQLLSTVRARQNMTFSLGNSLLASVQTDIDAVDLRLLHRHVLQKGWGSSQVLLDVRVLKLQRQVQATLEIAGRGELRAKLSNWPAQRASVQFELRSYVSGRQGLLTADWNLSLRTASILIKATSPTTGASAGNFNFSGAINLSVGSLRLLAEQPNIRARQRLEITWPKLGSMRLDFEKTSIDNRWGPDIHLAVERPSSGGRLTFLLNTSEPKIEQIGLAYRSSDVAEGYAATVRYVRYGHEFRADARGRGGVTFNGASNQLPLFNLTVEQALDLYGLEDAAPFSDIAKQLRLSAQLIATRRGEVDLAWWLTSPVSAFGLEPVVGMEVLTRWWPLHLRLGLATPVAHWRRCSAELRCQLSRRVALLSAALSGPSSNFVALYEHEFDEALTNLKARVHYQNNLLILTFEPQLLNASVAAVLAGSGETNLRGFIKTSWRSLQQLEFVATPAAAYIDRIAHGESLRIFDARRISNRNVDPKGYIRRRDDWVLGIAFGVNSIEAFVANASIGLNSGGGIDDSDFELTLSGATAGMDLLSSRIYCLTSNGSSGNPVISSGLRVICPVVTLNATEEATVGENGRKRWQLFLYDGGDAVTADVRFRGTRLDPDPTAQSSVIIRGTKYSVQQPDGPSSLRITASGFEPVDFNWSVQATSLARFRFRLNSKHRAKSSSETTVGTLDVEADWPSRIRAVFGRGANLASVKLGISTSSLSLIHSANGSFDGRVPLAPGLALRLPTPPGPVNLTAVWTPDDWLSNGLLNLDFWSSWRFRHRHRVVLSAAASEAQIETVSNSWRIFCNHSTASRTVQIFGSSNGFGDVNITQNSLKVSLADSADKLDMLYPNLFQFPWNNQDNVKSLKFAANLTAPTLGLLRPASLNIVRMVALDSQLKVRNVSLVCTYQADGGLQQADVTIAKAFTKSQGSKLIGTVMTKGFKLIQALHYEAEVNWKSANGEATAGVACREQAKQLLAVQVFASKTGIAEFNAETSTNQSACRGRVVLPYLVKSRAPLLHFSMTDQVRIAFNASSDVKNWQFEWYTMIRHFKVSRTTIDGVSKWHLTPDFRRTSGVVLSNSPSNGTTELRLPWRTIRLVQRRLTANLWELMLWPDAINRPFDANKLRCLTVSGSSLNYTIELTSPYLASPGLVVSLSSNATRMQLLVALTRAIRLDLKASLLQEVSLKRLQIFASLITPDATSRMEAGADLPAKMERIGPVALRNGRMKILLGKSMSNDHRGGIAHQIEFELAPFQRFYFSMKDSSLLDLSFNQASGRLVWQLLTSRSGAGGNGTQSVKDSAAARVLAVVDAANSDAQIEVSSGLLNRQHRIYWPTQVPALLFAVFNGTAAHAGALAVNSDSDSVKDARKIDLWFSESVPANVSFGFAGFHLSRNGSMELATSWRLPREPVFHVQLLSIINSRLIANLPSASALRQALAEGSRVALTGSGDALQYELFAWQARPDSDLTLAASDLTAGWNFICQISSRDEFYLKSVATPLLSRFGGLSNRVCKLGWQRILTIRNQMRRFQLSQSRPPGSYSAPGWLHTALERLALRWRHAVSGHLGRLRRAWMRLRELDQRPAEARQDYSEAEYDIYWLQNFLTPDDSFEYSTAAQVMQNSLVSMGSEAAARLHGILFAHLADYKRLYDWLDDMGYEVRRLMSMKLDPLPELDSELLALARLWLRTKRRSDIFQRLTGLDSNQVLSWQPRCRADCSELGGTGVAQFRAQIRARVPRLRPAEWRRLAGRLARFARVAMDAIDFAIATVNGADKATRLETD
ncbi:hypothetical protein BOX15_Mlig032922g3 [Macrostomum lignano]|uniref:VWFD domain-containing protein n=1 Tax=Macrostomum lignano TaxID=282301 RepID=A0A267DS17_9PLAT|nr:hypothetical protein BOX15_Mlig032922g3 [Macrostomum lignano]